MAIDPGVMTAAKMDDPATLERINATGADFLLVALGAQKGRAWLMDNRQKLTVPIASHLGATLNFLAGTIRRAPVGLRRLGLEWLWRIGQEPYLATRYLFDGVRLLGLLISRVAPLGLWLRWNERGGSIQGLSAWLDTGQAGQVLMLEKAALRQNMPLAFTGASPSVGRALKWCGLRHLFGKKAA